MTRISTLPLYALLLAGFAAAPAMAQEASSQPQSQGHSWDALDTDGDGSLSRAEAAAHPGLAAVFGDVDADGDGKLTAAEYRDYAARQTPATANEAATPEPQPEPEEEPTR